MLIDVHPPLSPALVVEVAGARLVALALALRPPRLGGRRVAAPAPLVGLHPEVVVTFAALTAPGSQVEN